MTRSSRSRPNTYFWGLTGLTLSLLGLGLILTLSYGQGWLHLLWTFCRGQFQQLNHPPHLLLWQLIIPTIFVLMLSRGGLSLVRQIRATTRLAETFYPLRRALPSRLTSLLAEHRLPARQVVFLDIATPHAFCLGFFRPRIWLTAGLVELLSDTELNAVLAHEAHHCRNRDPLRLVISRALKAAFFFLPVIGDLAQAADLQQEISADQAAIAHLRDDLPLLCAIQKLMKRQLVPVQPASFIPLPEAAAFSSFNVTEARLKRLVYPPKPIQWRRYALRWSLNLGIIAILAGVAFQSAPPANAGSELVTCTPDQPTNISQSLVWLDYDAQLNPHLTEK